jgi:hypothetical protein
VFLTRSHVLQRHTLRIISVIPLVFQDRVRGANPRITGHILPLKQPQLQLFHDDLVIIFPRQIVQFLRVVFQIVQLPFRPVVILLQSFEPVQIFFVSGAVQNALKRGGQVEVLVDGKGALVIQIVDQFVAVRSDHAHRVIHRDLVQNVAGEHCLPCGVLGFYKRPKNLRRLSILCKTFV